MPSQIDDFTAMWEWDLTSGILENLKRGVSPRETYDWTSTIIETGDVQVIAPVLSSMESMEEELFHEATLGTKNAFFRDFDAIFSAFLTWYVSGDEGTYTNIQAALDGRLYRIAHTMRDAWLSQQGGSIGSHYLFPVENVILSEAVRGNIPSYPSVLPTLVDYARLIVVCNELIGGVNLVVAFTATYSDDTTGAETITATAASPANTEFQVAENDITTPVMSGATTVPIAATAGLVAGQQVIVQDRYWTARLLTDCIAGETTFTVEDSQAFAAGNAVQLHDDNTADEAATILSVNHELREIVVSAGVAGNFNTNQDAYIRLNVEQDYGWCEVVGISTVTLNTSIVVDAALNHTYSDQAVTQRLIKSIAALTLTNGTPSDCIDVVAIPESSEL